MITLIVHVKVRPEAVEAWKAVSAENVLESRKEAGILAFELLADRADPTRFVLYEIYRDEAAMASHKQTAHYRHWAGVAEPLQAEPRGRAFYDTLVPPSP